MVVPASLLLFIYSFLLFLHTMQSFKQYLQNYMTVVSKDAYCQVLITCEFEITNAIKHVLVINPYTQQPMLKQREESKGDKLSKNWKTKWHTQKAFGNYTKKVNK